MIIKGKPKYDGVLNIPEGKSGDFEIVHQVLPAGSKLQTVTFRTAMHAGHRAKSIVYDYPTRWHKLTENGGVWMSDLPIEQFQHDEVFKGKPSPGFRGRVLVGGLGLGYAITALSARRFVTEIVVVEQSQDVANLVYEHTRTPKTTLVVADLHEYLKRDDIGKFDYGFYDIWQADGEATFHLTVMPLRAASKGKVRRVENWNEDVMRGQLFHGLHSRLMWLQIMSSTKELPSGWSPAEMPTIDDLAEASRHGKKIDSIWVTWAQPFWKWVRATKPGMAEAQQMAATYCQLYGIGNEYLSLCLDQPVKTAGLGADDPDMDDQDVMKHSADLTFGVIDEAGSADS